MRSEWGVYIIHISNIDDRHSINQAMHRLNKDKGRERENEKSLKFSFKKKMKECSRCLLQMEMIFQKKSYVNIYYFALIVSTESVFRIRLPGSKKKD